MEPLTYVPRALLVECQIFGIGTWVVRVLFSGLVLFLLLRVSGKGLPIHGIIFLLPDSC